MRYRRFGTALRAYLIVQGLLGAWLLSSPDSVAAALGESGRLEGIGAHLAGLGILLLTLSATPAAVVPRAHRFLGLYAALAAGALCVFLLVAGGGFWLPALAFAAIFVVLVWLYWLDFREELMARP